MRDAGSTVARIWGGIKGALSNLQYVNNVGPKALNGGEVVISDGKCLREESMSSLLMVVRRW